MDSTPFSKYGKPALCFLVAIVTTGRLYPADFDAATAATNTVGLELFRQMAKPDENFCLSPYSIETALAMTFAGSDGETRAEMARVLHLGADETIHASFSALQKAMDGSVQKSNDVAAQSKKFGGASEPITLAVANRLFPQTGYPIRQEFTSAMQRFYHGNLEPLDFRGNANSARQHINTWVAQQTRDRIQDLIPPNGVDNTTRLVLANALYLKAPWETEFNDALTKPAPFHVRSREQADVPTMQRVGHLGFLQKKDWTLVAIPYVGSEMQFLILLPDEKAGGKEMLEKITPQLLLESAKLTASLVDLSLPKFKFSSPTLPLAASLQKLGLKTAFDQPPGSANFDRMAPRKPNDYLAISEVFHKTFIAVDEKGTEAAAATAVSMVAGARMVREDPIVVRVDRPFVYAIQHVPTGACLFIGQVVDPR